MCNRRLVMGLLGVSVVAALVALGTEANAGICTKPPCASTPWYAGSCICCTTTKSENFNFTALGVPGWFVNVATIIHSDEALLATGFIFTVHFFNTHLRPEKFPMDVVIFTGRMPVEELKRDKPAEYDALMEKGELESQLVEAYPPIVTRTVRMFAWTALGIGFGMVVWIVYAMLFAYK